MFRSVQYFNLKYHVYFILKYLCSLEKITWCLYFNFSYGIYLDIFALI